MCSYDALPLVTDLGPGEAQVLALALETPGAVLVVDDGLGRQKPGIAEMPEYWPQSQDSPE